MRIKVRHSATELKVLGFGCTCFVLLDLLMMFTR